MPIRLASPGRCVVAALVLSVLGGNIFSVRVGLASATDRAVVITSPDGASSADVVALPEQFQRSTSQRDLQYLMHLMGLA